jgi:hypothetical protein
MKKLSDLGRSLSKTEQKKIMGGYDDGGGGGCGCTTNADCVTAKCGDTCSSFNNKNVCWYNPF